MKINNKFIKNLVLVIASFAIYFLATYPSRNLFTVFTVTDVRPGVVFNPLLSMCFGPWATLGLTIATTLGDYLSGYPRLVLYQGFVGQFIYGYLSYLTWSKLTKNDEHRYRLDSLDKILKFAATSLTFAISSAIGVGYIVHSNFGANAFDTGIFVFLNNFDFTMILGMPILILSNLIIHKVSTGEKRKLSKNEGIILINVLSSALSLAVITYAVYQKIGNIGDIYTIWNTIYIYGAIAINIILFVAYLYIYVSQKRK